MAAITSWVWQILLTSKVLYILSAALLLHNHYLFFLAFRITHHFSLIVRLLHWQQLKFGTIQK